MVSVFLDTGYLIAQEMDDDQRYEAAVRHWQSVSRGRPDLVTTSLVLT